MEAAQFQLHARIEDEHWWFTARRHILGEVVRAVAKPTGGRNQIVVDVGCGTGANLAALAADYRCVGVDPSREAIELARERFPDVTYICGQAPDEVRPWLARADVIILADVLEHVFDDRRLLESIVDVAAPQAQIVVTVPADMALWSPHDTAFGHFRRYDRLTLSRVWAGLPVRQRMLSYFNRRLYPAVRLARAVSRFRGRASGHAQTDFKLPIAPINWALRELFAGEADRLVANLDSAAQAYSRGVSLIAVLERQTPTLPADFSSGDGLSRQAHPATQLETAGL